MKKSELQIGKLYESSGMVLECQRLGSSPKFKVVYPYLLRGQEKMLQAREIRRELSEREAEAFRGKK